MERFDIEHDNLRTALEWSLGSGVVGRQEVSLRLAGAIWQFWFVLGYMSEMREWLERVLARSGGASSSTRAKVVVGAGWIKSLQGEVGQGTALIEEGVTLYREVGDKNGIAWSLEALGVVLALQGDYERAQPLFEESLTLSREMGLKFKTAYILEGLAPVAVAEGQPEQAARLFGAAQSLRETIGSSLSPAEREEYDQGVAAVRTGLGEDEFAKAWAEGRKMSMDEAIEYGLHSETDG